MKTKDDYLASNASADETDEKKTNDNVRNLKNSIKINTFFFKCGNKILDVLMQKFINLIFIKLTNLINTISYRFCLSFFISQVVSTIDKYLL